MSLNNPDGGQSVDVLILEDKIAKIRTQVNSKLENQKNLALILLAVEENIEEQKNDKTPVAYVVSFLALLDQAVADDEITETNVATAAAYFLDLVLPYAPKPLLKQKFAAILTKLAPVLTSQKADAALVRSSIGSLETLLLAQDNQQWLAAGNVSPRRALVGMLELSFDPRPKVRKRAQEAVHKILANPPPLPLPLHPCSGLCADLALQKVESLLEAAPKKKHSTNKELNLAIIHTLQLVTAITSANAWPAGKIDHLCDILLDISRTSDQYMVSAAFAAFDGLFSSMSHEIDIDRFTRVLDIIFDLKPPVDDTHLAAAWLAVVANGFQAFAKLLPELCLGRIEALVPSVADFLAAESKDIYVSASQCLIAIISESIPDDYLLQPTAANGIAPEIYEKVDDVVAFLAEFIEKELLSIKYQHATREILEVATASVLKLRTRANPDFIGILEVVGQWRSNEVENFPHNKEAEDFVAACVSTMGPEVVLSSLPLNLTNSLQNGGPGRAWLLPILRDNVRFASLRYYQRQILPLVEFFGDKIEAAPQKDSMHIKIFQTIVDQVWDLLPHFSDLPTDLQEAFTDEFAASLADLLYSKVELRPVICNALRLMVESNLVYSTGALADDKLMLQEFPIDRALLNVQYLASKASNVLSVLFNVFSSTMPDTRSFVLETINVYLQITPKADLEVTFDKVCGLLKKSLDDEASHTAPAKKNEPPKLSVTMMDLIVTMAKYVPQTSYNALFAIFSSTVTMGNNVMMQKRAFRILTKLSEAEYGDQAMLQYIGEIENVFVETTNSTHTAARAARLAAMLYIVKILPATDLHFIPSVLQEVIMSTKDVNEKSREAAYGLLIQMGRKMQQGGVVENGKVHGFDPNAPATEANLSNFFTMVSAGLAAQSPHMISAAITAISCLVYEFKDALPQEVLLEIASTVELFLTHKSKEIAKSAIGFVKVEVLSLPEQYIRENLAEMLAKLMRWSHEHSNHFKQKVKHIVERLIRKFGIDAVEQAIPEEDRKLVANIKKTRARAKKREAEEEDAGEAAPADHKSLKKFMSAYEEAVYDSDSESSDDENTPRNKTSARNKAGEKFILDTGDEPLNLLDRQTLAHISSSKPKKFSKKDIQKHNVETKNGKLVFKDLVKANDDPLGALGSGIDAYLDAVKQAPVRGQKNKLKFKKTKDDDDWSDSDDERKPVSASARHAPKGKFSKKAGVSKPKLKFKARKKL